MKPEEEDETQFDSRPLAAGNVRPEASESADSGAASPVDAAGEGPDSPDGDSEIDQLRAALAAAEQAAAESQDLYLRERAEVENFKKRSMRERTEALRYATEPLARDLFTVVDNLERALEHARSGGDTGAVVEGVEMVLKGALEMLGRHGIERIDAVGQEFDPVLHEALAQVPDDSVQANRVVEQFLPGYRLHERLLRAAQVTVSTGAAQD